MNRISPLLWVLLLAPSCSAAAAEFIYRGQLFDAGQPAEGRYDLRLTLYADAAGSLALSLPAEVEGVQVSQGRFAVPVFLPGLSDAVAGGWIDVAARVVDEPNWETVPERSYVALKAGACPNDWSLEGNAGLDPALNFLGTTDAQPLEMRASNTRAGRLERVTSSSPVSNETATNVLFGDPSNRIDSGVVGATISGGGGVTFEGAFTPKPNRVTGRFGTVGGGMGNSASSRAQVGGGLQNTAAADASVGGGLFNVAGGSGSVIAGGQSNDATGTTATICGGTSNIAFGAGSSIGGGSSNQARGIRAVVPGGAGVVAGGDFSFATGRKAIVRSRDGAGVRGTGEAETCDDVVGAEVCGDEGTFLFTDSRDRALVSQGPNQFLIRAEGGVGIQPGSDGSGDELANVPDALLHVFGGSAGTISVPASNTIAVFESDTHAFLRLLSPDASERGLLFGDPVGGSADGGIVYTGVNSLQFRTNGNAARMTLDGTGLLSVNNDVSVGDALSVGGAAVVNGPLRVISLGSAGSLALCRNSSNQIASCSSSQRYKEDIATLDLGLDTVLALRPVAYRWKSDGAADVGFVAEEVARLDPRLVTHNAQGEIEAVKYDRLSAVLAAALQELWLRDQTRSAEIEALRSSQARVLAELETLRHDRIAAPRSAQP